MSQSQVKLLGFGQINACWFFIAQATCQPEGVKTRMTAIVLAGVYFLRSIMFICVMVAISLKGRESQKLTMTRSYVWAQIITAAILVANCVRHFRVQSLEWGHFDWMASLLWAILGLINIWSIHLLNRFQNQQLSD